MVKKIILLIIVLFGLTTFQYSQTKLIYLVVDGIVTDENACPDSKWSIIQEKLQKKLNYILKVITADDISVASNSDSELSKATWIIDNTVNSRFTLNLVSLLKTNKNRILSVLLKKIMILVVEPPVVYTKIWDSELHDKLALVFTWNDSLFNTKNYAPLRFPSHNGLKLDNIVPFEQRKLCCLINGNKSSSHPESLYQKRLNDILFFEAIHPNEFDFYGVGWPKDKYKTYHGWIHDYAKKEYLGKYKFCLCYENMRAPGLVTEKIFHCFEAGCVPIYLGAHNISKFVPENCFVDRTKFKDMAQLYQFISNVSKTEFDNYLSNIKKYLNSNQPYEFTEQRFTEYIVDGILSLK